MRPLTNLGRGMAFLATGVLLIIQFAAAGTPGRMYPVRFTLISGDCDLAPVPFSLTTHSEATVALAGPDGPGVIEDCVNANTGVGCYALANNAGERNTAFGYKALTFITTGKDNTAIGAQALPNNFTGNYNTAVGSYSLQSSTGSHNTAVGFNALNLSTDGGENTAVGMGSLWFLVQGSGNTAIGGQALVHVQNGWLNTALGSDAGFKCLGGYSNIFIGAGVEGEADDANTMRIGLKYGPHPNGGPWVGQNRTFISGVVETPFSAGDEPAAVGITSDGRLGTMSNDLLSQTLSMSGSLLFLVSGSTPPSSGYVFLGTTDIVLTVPGAKRTSKITVAVYRKE